LRLCSNFNLVETEHGWTGSYIRQEHGKRHVVIATSIDGYAWIIRGSFSNNSKKRRGNSGNRNRKQIMYTLVIYFSNTEQLHMI
jgi:hypothetical protein